MLPMDARALIESRMKRQVDTCCVVNQHCTSPANITPLVAARATCFSCGEAVCSAHGCSLITTYHQHGRQRICFRCLEDRKDESTTLARAWVRINSDIVVAAGYDKGSDAHKRELAWLKDGDPWLQASA